MATVEVVEVPTVVVGCENDYTYKGILYKCDKQFNCCDCGGNECGCHYCFSCKACEFCLKEE